MADSSAHTPDELLAYLDDLGISHSTISHPPVFTVDEAKRLRGSLPGGHSKSLFLKNKEGRMWLVVVGEDQRVDLDVLAGALEAKRLSFGSPERLMRYLGVIPGAVTPFAVINDSGNGVMAAVSAALLAHDQLSFHPLANDQTTSISSKDLLRFLASTGHEPRVLEAAELASPVG